MHDVTRWWHCENREGITAWRCGTLYNNIEEERTLTGFRCS